MRVKVWIMTIIMIGLSAGGGTVCAAGPDPMATIKVKIDQIIKILNNPQYDTPAKRDEQRKKIWEVARPLFDFQDISRRTVGPGWRRFSPDEKTHFVQVFSKFLGNTYIDKIQGEYHDEKVVFEKELVRSPYALVRSRVVRKNTSIPIDYRMKLEDGQWKIYDILVENGVSIVQNYRVQFQSFLQKNTPVQLIQQLEKKLKEQHSIL